MRFNKCYDDPIVPGPAIFFFEDDDVFRTLNGTVTGVERHRLDRRTAAQARLGADTSIDQLKEGLQGHYPGLPSDAEVDVVFFTTEATSAAR